MRIYKLSTDEFQDNDLLKKYTGHIVIGNRGSHFFVYMEKDRARITNSIPKIFIEQLNLTTDVSKPFNKGGRVTEDNDGYPETFIPIDIKPGPMNMAPHVPLHIPFDRRLSQLETLSIEQAEKIKKLEERMEDKFKVNTEVHSTFERMYDKLEERLNTREKTNTEIQNVLNGKLKTFDSFWTKTVNSLTGRIEKIETPPSVLLEANENNCSSEFKDVTERLTKLEENIHDCENSCLKLSDIDGKLKADKEQININISNIKNLQKFRLSQERIAHRDIRFKELDDKLKADKEQISDNDKITNTRLNGLNAKINNIKYSFNNFILED